MIVYNWTKNKNSFDDIYCFACGTATLSKNGIQKCTHLILIGTSDSIEYDRNDLMNMYDEEDGNRIDYLKEKLSDDFLMLWRNNPPPSFTDEYFVFSNF